MSLDQLLDIPLVSASRFEQKSSETPSTVSVVTQDDIRQYSWRTLGEVVRGLRGFYVHYDRSYEYVGPGGFARPQDSNTRVRLLVDGHRMNDAVYDMTDIGTDSIIDLGLAASDLKLSLGARDDWMSHQTGREWSAFLYYLFDCRFYDPAAHDPGVPNRDRFTQDGRTFRVRTVCHF